MPKLSELHPDDYKVVSTPDAPAADSSGLKLSSLDPAQVKVVSQPPNARQPKTEFESGLAGATQGATLGFGDELYGGLMGFVKKMARKGDFQENYEKYRDENRQFNKEAAADNPKSYFGGNLAGGLVTAFVPGAGALKGAGLGKTVLQGAALGGITGAGVSESNPLKSPESAMNFAGDVGTGAAIGGAFSGAGYGINKAVGALAPDSLREYANKRALTASGFMAKDIKKLSPEQQQEIGRNLLNSKVVTALSSLDDVAERASAGKQAAGEAIGNALNTVDNHVKDLVSGIDSGKVLQGASDEQKAIAKKYIADNFQFNMRNIGQRIKDELIAPNADNPLVKNELSRLSNLSDDFAGKANQSLGFGNLIKATQGKQTRFQSETVPEEFKKDVYRIIKEELEGAVGRTGDLEAGISKLGTMAGDQKALGNASDIAARNNQALGDYKDAKGLYQAMKAAETASNSRLGQTNVNRTISLTDYIAGGAGLASGGGPTAAVALGALNKIGRKYGASVQAVGANKLADALEAVQGVTTDQLSAAIGKAISKSPAIAQKYGGMIAKAATEGKASLVAVHAALLKDPDYAAAVDPQDTTPMQRKLKQVQGGR